MALERRSGGSAGGTVGATTILFSRFQLAEQRSMETRISPYLQKTYGESWKPFLNTDNGHVGTNVLKNGLMSGW